MRKIRVLVIDDSVFFRKLLVEAINKNPVFEVVCEAGDPFEARDKIIEYRPDIMTLDIEMPRMNGIEFLKRLIPQYPIPAIVVSSLNVNVFDALDAGAVDFVNKPTGMSVEAINHFVDTELAMKLKIASTAKIGSKKFVRPDSILQVNKNTTDSHFKVIAIGASTGGTEAISALLSGFSSDVPGIVMTQHMPFGFTQMFASRLNEEGALRVREAKNGDKIERGLALLAPGDMHMRVVKVGNELQVECKPGEKVSGHCPSVDVLFESVANAVGKDAIGIILTGMGADGANGLLKMKTSGAETIGQDEASCVVYGMPKVAYELGAVKYKLPLDAMSQKVYSLL
ncbi:MAG: chemotaxis response regulator protein-glutamate methylesterase [Lachnospiraceae bacterium]|nr:chemotaxis response regulator protein-glutamate methylesterase [Lachnospiraceae bacterium]